MTEGHHHRPRDRLLAAAVEQMAQQHGIEVSLRKLADAIGTSHRMLIYHFGSREGLLIAVVQAVEQRQREALASFERELAGRATLAELTRRMWRRLADPALSAHERLFFELYGRALRGDPALEPFLDGIVSSWMEPVTSALRRIGVPARVADTQARLGMAVMRGLLLDLLATGDRKATDRALEHFITLSAAVEQTSPPASRPARLPRT